MRLPSEPRIVYWPSPVPRTARGADPKRPGRGLSRPDYARRRARYEAKQRRRWLRDVTAPLMPPLPDLPEPASPVEDSPPRAAPTAEAAVAQRQEHAKCAAEERFDRICDGQRKRSRRAGVPKYPEGQRAYWRAQRIKPGGDERPLLSPRVLRAHRQRHASATAPVA